MSEVFHVKFLKFFSWFKFKNDHLHNADVIPMRLVTICLLVYDVWCGKKKTMRGSNDYKICAVGMNAFVHVLKTN